MAKISKSAIEKRIIANSGGTSAPTSGEVLEVMIKRFKKEVKNEGVLDNLKMHQYFMTKQERKQFKEKMNKQKKKG